MSDGRNEARALRVLEIANDFRTLQVHINTHVTRAGASPPDQASAALDGYRLLAQARVQAQRILAYTPGSLGITPGSVPNTEVQRAQLQRVILDISTRRFQAHTIYLRVAAAVRWLANRAQVLQGQAPGPRHAAALQAVDQRLRQEVAAITDQHVFNDLRSADVRKGYWTAEDPTLDRILAWARSQS